MNTKIIIKNVQEDKKYKGRYQKIFKILEKDMIFSERFETDDSIGWFEGNYYLTIEGTINPSEQEAIEKLKSVFIQD